MMEMPLKGKVVLITGGSSGIGKQLAEDMASAGASVVVCCRSNEKLNSAQADFRSKNLTISGILCDITKQDQVQTMISSVEQKFGHLDILVNNAGYAVYETFDESTLNELVQLIDVNLIGAIRCIKTALPGMMARKEGHVVNIASIAARMVITPNSCYGAAKHGMAALSEALKFELAPFHIHISVICPGRTKTAFFDHPSFQKRTHRPETEYTIPIEHVSKSIMSAIEHKRFMTYVPGRFGLLVWLLNTFPFFLKPLYGRVLSSRIRSIHDSRATASALHTTSIEKDTL